MAIVLTFFYALLGASLRNYTDFETSNKRVFYVFIVFVVIFLLRAFYSIGLNEYRYKIVCQI